MIFSILRQNLHAGRCRKYAVEVRLQQIQRDALSEKYEPVPSSASGVAVPGLQQRRQGGTRCSQADSEARQQHTRPVSGITLCDRFIDLPRSQDGETCLERHGDWVNCHRVHDNSSTFTPDMNSRRYTGLSPHSERKRTILQAMLGLSWIIGLGCMLDSSCCQSMSESLYIGSSALCCT